MKKEKTGVPAFFSRQPLLPHAQKFSSNPATILPPERYLAPTLPAPNATHSSADTPQSNSSELPFSVSQETKTPRDAASVTSQLSDGVANPIPHNSSFNLPGPAKLPGSPAKTIGSQKKKSSTPEVSSYDYELQRSPLQVPSSHSSLLKERPLSFLDLGDAVESGDDLGASDLFKFSFGDSRTQKKCLAKFFNSTAVIDPRISAPVKQFFCKILLRSLTPKLIAAKPLDPNSIEAKKLHLKPTEANMLLGDSADDRQIPALKEILRYLKEEMPSPKDIDVEAYIEAIAKRQAAGEFPYADLEQEKLDFLRYALQQNYNFFEYIFTANDTSPEEKSYTFFRIQRWLYHSLSHQFILNENEDIVERVHSELPSDEKSEDESEEEIQIPSQLKVAYSDLQQALYQHLKTLLKKNKSLSTSSTKTAFLLVYQLSFEWIHKNTEEAETELNALFDLLLQMPAGIHFLCAVKDAGKERPMEKWLNLLEEKRAFKLFDKILSILPRLNSKQVLALLDSTLMDILTDCLSPRQELHLLHKLLDLNLSVVDMHICEDSELMQIAKKHGSVEMLQERIWLSFSLESLESQEEIQRAYFRDNTLIVESKKTLAKLLDLPVLNTFLLEKAHNTEFGIKKSSIRAVWIEAFKTIWCLVLGYWRPNDEDLDKISYIKELWINTMIKTLSDDYSAYNPQNYTIDKLPQTMWAALEDKIEVLKQYQEQLGIMADCYHRLIACVVVRYSADTPSSARENRIPFIELIGTLAAQKGIKCTEAQIQACAEDLSRWFKEVIATGKVYPLESMFYDLTKNSSEAANVLYLSTRYAELFLELLENAMPKKSSFPMLSSTGIVLREKETKDAINAFLRALIKQKPVESTNKASPSLTIFRSPPDTPKVERASASPYPFSPLSLSSRMD